MIYIYIGMDDRNIYVCVCMCVGVYYDDCHFVRFEEASGQVWIISS